MADQTLPKNTLKLAEFEKKVIDIEDKTSATQELVKTELEQIKQLKEDMLNIKTTSDQKLSSSNEKISTKIKEKFKKELQEGEKRIAENEEASTILQREIEELFRQISILDAEGFSKIIIYRRKQKELEDLKNQYQLLKENYDEAAKENEKFRKEIEEKTVKTTTLDTQIEDMKQVIAKLTDARVILNKYFSTHYENFTEEEKKLIAEIEGNVFPGYYNNNPIIPDIKPIDIEVKKSVLPELSSNVNVNKPDINLNKLYQDVMPNEEGRNFLIKKSSNDIKPSSGRIMNADEYQAYQMRLKQQAQPQVGNRRSYVGKDDEYWYEQNKNNK